jgi:hypothetical protein
MHAAAWRRLLAVLLAIWFPLYAVEPAALVACPMHGAPHAAAAEHHAPTGSHDAPASHHCTCLGDCCASTVAMSTPELVAPIVPATLVAVRVVVRAPSSYAPRAAEHALPFATAPPLA